MEITINDFIQSNALDVSESYFRRTASSIALADRLDIYKQSDIGSLIDKATAKTFGGEGFSEAAAVQAKKDLKFAVDRIQGIPQEEFSMLNKAMSQWRDFNVIRLMGGAVWNQVSELSQIVGSMGWKATLGAASELRAIRRDIATGKAPHDFLDHPENTIGGVGPAAAPQQHSTRGPVPQRIGERLPDRRKRHEVTLQRPLTAPAGSRLGGFSFHRS
ncbi:hypothetical protein [Variovorax sp. Varisp62]|uniref:hypothetical protein n=1 Tax=Variovorax sp. Varisp62 TaxID=3243049 RepID=UPI0039B63C92